MAVRRHGPLIDYLFRGARRVAHGLLVGIPMLVGVLWTGPAAVSAQGWGGDSLRSLEEARVFDVHRATGNPAALLLRPAPEYGSVRASGAGLSGNFKRPMEPGRSLGLGARAEGWKKVRDTGYGGSFDYRKKYEGDVPWNGVYDPYEGNPFLWADSSSGKWDKDYVRAGLDFSRPFSGERILTGLHMGYKVATGARTSDPKPFYRFRDLALQSGILVRTGQTGYLGAMGGISFLLENNELGYHSSGGGNVLLYRLRGYGTFSKVPFVNGERTRRGTRQQVGLHYVRQGSDYRFLVHGMVGREKETVLEGIAAPEATGVFTALHWEGGIYGYHGDALYGKSVGLEAQFRQERAEDQVFQAESASSVNQRYTVAISWWNYDEPAQLRYMVTLEPVLASRKLEDKGAGTRLTVHSAGLEARFRFRRQVARRVYAELAPATGYFRSFDNAFGSKSDNTVIRELIRPDFVVMSSAYAENKMGLSLAWLSAATSLEHTVSCSLAYKKMHNSDIAAARLRWELQYVLLF